MNAQEFRKHIENDGKLKACQRINPNCTEVQVDAMIWTYVQRLLQSKKAAAAGVVLLGTTLFDPRPECVRKVWKAIDANSKLLIQGGAAQSKSYTGIAWIWLDWLADPEYTTVKLISTTGGHAKSNTFSTIASLHKAAICKVPGEVSAESISLEPTNKRACISIVRIKEGEDNSGVLQGFHPLPRLVPHKVFGPSSRVRAVLDEAEEIPNGVWTGVDNMLSSAHGPDAIKVMGFYNPKDITAKTAQLGEPVGGWGQFDIETGVQGKDEWISREGWTVLRLDPKKSENVKERRLIFEGLQTWEGYRMLESKDGGNSLKYFTFGRGCYPPDSVLCTVVPQRIMQQMRGEFIFSGKTIKLGSADIAIDGRDEAIMSVGRFGRARGFKKLDRDGTTWQTTMWREERDCLQLDQQFALPKGSAEIVGKAVKLNAVRLGIAPENMMIDCTGNGSPVWNYLKIPDVWSPYVKGLDFSQPATEMKVLSQNKKTAVEEFEGIWSEVWFALSRWGEFGYFAISPSVRSDDLERELIGRRYLLAAGETLKVEKKEIYNKRLGRSPDHADSATILVHLARIIGKVVASMTGESDKTIQEPEAGLGIVDKIVWVN